MKTRYFAVFAAVIAAGACSWAADRGARKADRSASMTDKIAKSVVRIKTDRPAPAGWHALGIVVNKEGGVLTTDHAVAGARSISVIFPDGEAASATVEGSEPASDVAVLEVPKHGGVRPVILGDSGSLRKGDQLYTVEPSTDSSGGFAVSLSQGSIIDLHQKIAPLRSALIMIAKSVRLGGGGPVLDRSGNLVAMTVVGSVPVEKTPDAAHAAVPVNVIKPILDRLSVLYTNNR